MADRTVTATSVQNEGALVTHGLNFKYATFSMEKAIGYGASISNSLMIQMIALPNGARVIDLWVTLYNRTDGAFAVGDGSLSNRFITAKSMTADGQTNFLDAPHGAGWKVSTTASDETRFEPIILTTTAATASASTTGCIHMGVYYLMEPAT